MIKKRFVVAISMAAVLLFAGCAGTAATALATPSPTRPPVASAKPFMELITGSAGIVDYQPNANAAEALEEASYVFAGTVVGLAEITEPTGDDRWAERFVVLEVRVLDPIKRDPGDPAYVGIPVGPTVDRTEVEATVPYGAKIAVRTLASTDDSDPAAPGAKTIRPVIVEGLYLQAAEDRTMIGGHMGEGSCPRWLKTCTVEAYVAALKAAR